MVFNKQNTNIKIVDKEITKIYDILDYLRRRYLRLSGEPQTVTGDVTFSGDISLDSLDLTSNPEYMLVQEAGSYVVKKVPWVFDITEDPTGFVDPEDITVTYDSATRKITLTGTSITLLWQGVKIWDGITTWTSQAHDAVNGMWFLYFDGTDFIWTNAITGFDILKVAQIAFVYYGASDKFAIRECHGLMPWQAHKEFHQTIGTYRVTGGSLNGYVIPPTSDAENRPGIDGCLIADEDLETTNSAWANDGPYTLAYLLGAGGDFTFLKNEANISALTGGICSWNEYTGGAWQLTAMAVSKYANIWLVAAPMTADAGSQEYRFFFMQPQQEYTSASEAEAEDPRELDYGTLTSLFTEFVFIAQITIQRIPGLTGAFKIVLIQDILGSREYPVGSPALLYTVNLTNPYMPYFDGDVLQDTSIYYDSANDRYGLCTVTSPSATVDVKSSDYTYPGLEVNGTQLMRFKYGPEGFGVVGAPIILRYTDTKSLTTGASHSSFLIHFKARDNSNGYLDETWFFGIQPQYNSTFTYRSHHLTGTTYVRCYECTNDTTDFLMEWVLSNDLSGFDDSIEITVMEIAAGHNEGHYGTFTTDVIANLTGGTELTRGGNGTAAFGYTGDHWLMGDTGVGIQSPENRLHAQIEDTAYNTVTYVLRIDHLATGTPIANNMGVGIDMRAENFYGDILSLATLEAINTDNGSYDKGNFLIKTYWEFDGAVGDGLQERVRVIYNGNMGIGTTAPVCRIEARTTDATSGTDWAAASEVIAAVAQDAYISIVSDDSATWGSALALKQTGAADGLFDNAWGIIRQTNDAGGGDGSLRFTYGTNTSPSSNTDYMYLSTTGTLYVPEQDIIAAQGNIQAGSTSKNTDTVIKSLADDSHICGFEAYGSSQGTGYCYVGQSITYGGGMFYNGDGAPAFATDEVNDTIGFYRRNSSTNYCVFYYAYSSNKVEFLGDIDLNGNDLLGGGTLYGDVLQLESNPQFTISNDGAAAFVLQTSGTGYSGRDIQIGRADGDNDVNILSKLCVGRTCAAGLASTQLHVYSGSSGATEHSYTRLLIEDDTHAAISIVTPNTSSGFIMFGDPEDDNSGQIQYDHSANEMTFSTNNSDAVWITSTGRLKIANDHTAYGYLDVSYAGAAGVATICVGADSSSGSKSRTNSTDKAARVGCVHYTNAEEPVAIVNAFITSTQNRVAVGGGTSYLNASTDIQFYTAANQTTTTGTLRLTIDSAGKSSFTGAMEVDGTVTFNAENLYYSDTTFTIASETSDGSDSKILKLCGGGAAGANRGAFIECRGNEAASDAGLLRLWSGNSKAVYVNPTGGLGTGFVVGSPTDGDKGWGTINASAVYDDGSILTGYVLDKYYNKDYDIKTWDDKSHFETHANARAFENYYSTCFDLENYEKFIKENFCLPSFEDVEKSQEIQSTGRMINKLWESEEITAIHVIQLNNKIKTQNKEINELKARLDKMELLLAERG